MKNIFPTFWQALLINFIIPVVIGVPIIFFCLMNLTHSQIQLFNNYFGHLFTIPFLLFFLWKSKIAIKLRDFIITTKNSLLFTITLTVVVELIFFSLILSFEKIFHRDYSQFLTSSTQYLSVVHALILSPIIEELLYRRIFLHQFLKQYSILVALLLSTLLFVIPHIPVIIFPELFLVYFINGFFLGFLYYKFRSISLCILSHIIMNLISYLPIYSYFK